MDENFTKLANETVEALSRTNLSSYEWRFLMVLFRKTYGFQKKDDWIALSQIVEMSGMHKAHVSRSKKKLIERNIVTQTGNRIAFNKYHTQWRELPKQATVTQTGNIVTSSGNLPPPKQVITPPPIQAHTKETTTKESLQKKGLDLETKPTTTKPLNRTEFSDEDIARIAVALKSCGKEFAGWDDGYADKTWDQRTSLSHADRITYYQKAERAVFYSRQPGDRPKALAKRICLEIAGFVNDRGAMQSRLTTSEAEARRLFKEETGQELDEA